MNTNFLAGMRCPKCASDGPLRIDITIECNAYVYDDGVDLDSRQWSESTWDATSGCRCSDCGHTATVAAFTLNTCQAPSCANGPDVEDDGACDFCDQPASVVLDIGGGTYHCCDTHDTRCDTCGTVVDDDTAAQQRAAVTGLACPDCLPQGQ